MDIIYTFSSSLSRKSIYFYTFLSLGQLLQIRDAYSTQNPRYASGRVLVREGITDAFSYPSWHIFFALSASINPQHSHRYASGFSP